MLDFLFGHESAQALKNAVNLILAKAGGNTHVVLCPVVYDPDLGWYFWVFCGVKETGLIGTQIMFPRQIDGDRIRRDLIPALKAKGVAVTDAGDELQALAIAESLWPGEWAANLRKTVEAETT
jgi:hypothetical protein